MVSLKFIAHRLLWDDHPQHNHMTTSERPPPPQYNILLRKNSLGGGVQVLNFQDFVLESLFLALNLGGEEGGGMDAGAKADEFLEKFQREEGEHFQSKNLYSRFWTFKPGFLSMK